MTEGEGRVTEWLAEQREAMVLLLGDLVNTDSGTYDKTGVDAAGEPLRRFFDKAGLQVEILPHPTFGDAIRATLPHEAANDQRPIVLMGHRDTVFPKGEAGRRPFRVENGRAYGPGVADMKSGLVMNAFVIAALAKFGGHPAPIVALVTSDEEIASPSSRPVIEAQARMSRAVFNAEPSRAPNVITRGRKGGVFMSFDVYGKAAHSGAHYERGVSAIEELSRKVLSLHRLTDPDRGITVNVGLIGGGQTVNTIAPHACGEIDLRYVRSEDRAAMIDAIRGVVENCSLPGTTAQLTIKGEFLPLEETAESRALFDIYRQAAGDVGFAVEAEFTGGCADSGFTAGKGCPTLCSIGPVGDGGHTPDEYVLVDSLVPCAQALALSVMRLRS
ncbi:M20 family metallopeptidase [Microvirga sp. GCM10011540]|uniref:M20 family metallopeptidase n=1 Tax=Microvirga sp. GCM10011540 TaxID=3317338 RepID=UPI0036113125